MGNSKSGNSMPKYTRSLTSRGVQRGLRTYLTEAFEHLCKQEKFDLYNTVYNNRKFIVYMVNTTYMEKHLTVLPLNRNMDILGCSKLCNEFLVFDRKKKERIVLSASSVFVDLVCGGWYDDISRLLLKKLIRSKIISKSDARMIWQDLAD